MRIYNTILFITSSDAGTKNNPLGAKIITYLIFMPQPYYFVN